MTYADTVADPSPDAATPVARGPVLRLLAQLFLGLLLGGAAFDVGVGWFDAATDLSDGALHKVDPELGWTNLPGFRSEFVSINALGLRSPEVPSDAPGRELRIIGFGASNTYGAGVGGEGRGQTWSEQLQELCDTRQEDVRVLNGGVMGYSAVQAARRALRFLPIVKPDLILVFVPPGSQSLLDPSAARNYVRVGTSLVPQDIADMCPAPLLPLAAATHGALTHSAIYKRYRARASDAGRRAPDIDKFVLSRAPRSAEAEQLLQRTWAELEALGRVASEEGIEVRVLLYYEPHMDSEAGWRSFLRNNATNGAPPAGTPREQTLEVLREECERRGLKTWNIAAAIDIVGSDRARFTGDGQHWSHEGHGLIAKSIFEHIEREGLLDDLRRRRAARPRD